MTEPGLLDPDVTALRARALRAGDLPELTVNARPGALVGLVGGSASRARTALRVLAGTIRARSGQLEFAAAGDHLDACAAPVRELAWWRRHRVRLADGGLFASPTAGVEEAMTMAGDPHPAETLSRLRLGRVTGLPLGSVRSDLTTLAVAAALGGSVPILLLDVTHPTCDPEGLRGLLERRAESSAIVLAVTPATALLATDIVSLPEAQSACR